MEIREIENELEVLLRDDRKSWIRIFELMNEVQTEGLFLGKFPTFTTWVNDLANKTGVHVSLLWSRLKAGRNYAEFEKRATAKGKEVPALSEIQIPADSLNYVEKIAGSNAEMADELIEKILDGGMTRNDLRNAWKTVKAEREELGYKAARVNAHDKPSMFEMPELKDSSKAADIVLAMKTPSWLPEHDQVWAPTVPGSYKTFTEFALPIGSSRNARRLDVLALENITKDSLDRPYELALHGVEIKVSKSDLLNDHKMAEYTDFVDYFWIAVPENLLDEAKKIKLPEWGILIYDKKSEKLTPKIPADKLPAVMRDVALSTALVKLSRTQFNGVKPYSCEQE